jgi:hypothetical protein
MQWYLLSVKDMGTKFISTLSSFFSSSRSMEITADYRLALHWSSLVFRRAKWRKVYWSFSIKLNLLLQRKNYSTRFGIWRAYLEILFHVLHCINLQLNIKSFLISFEIGWITWGWNKCCVEDVFIFLITVQILTCSQSNRQFRWVPM